MKLYTLLLATYLAVPTAAQVGVGIDPAQFATAPQPQALAPQPLISQPAGSSDISEAIQAKVKSDLSVMISSFDFTQAIDNAVRETHGTEIKIHNEQQLNEAKLQQLLKQLGDMLQDPRVISSIWNDAETIDNEVFNHLHIKFNLDQDRVKIETAAKDVTGEPVKFATAPLLPKPVHSTGYKMEGEYDIMANQPFSLPTPPPTPMGLNPSQIPQHAFLN